MVTIQIRRYERHENPHYGVYAVGFGRGGEPNEDWHLPAIEFRAMSQQTARAMAEDFRLTILANTHETPVIIDFT